MNTSKAVGTVAAVTAAAFLIFDAGSSPDASAQPKAATRQSHKSAALIVTPSGCYELNLDSGGVPSLVLAEHQYEQVIVLTEPLPNPPGPQPTPTPIPVPVLSPRAKLLKAEADKATADTKRAETAAGLSMMYRALSKSAKEGTVKDAVAMTGAMKIATTAVLSRQNSQVAWQPFVDALSAQAAAASLKGVPELASLLDDAADALDATVPQQLLATAPDGRPLGVSPEFWDFLLKLLDIILKLLVK